MQQTFLVTGGAGFIGTNLVEALVAAGHVVTVVDDLTAGNKERLPKEVNFHQVDIRDTARLAEIMTNHDIVVHLAALPRVQFSIAEPQLTHDVNVNGTLSVLEAARGAGVRRVVYAASSSAYGDQETLPLSVDLPPQPKSPYALHKYFGEEMLRMWNQIYGLQTVSLRFFNVYGPHLDPDGPYALVIGRFLQLAARGEALTITGDGTQTRDFTHVHDVVSAIITSSQSDRVGNGEVLNVGAGQQTSINDLAHMIGAPITYVPARFEPKHTLADITLTTALLDWRPKISLGEGLADLKRAWGLSDS